MLHNVIRFVSWSYLIAVLLEVAAADEFFYCSLWDGNENYQDDDACKGFCRQFNGFINSNDELICFKRTERGKVYTRTENANGEFVCECGSGLKWIHGPRRNCATVPYPIFVTETPAENCQVGCRKITVFVTTEEWRNTLEWCHPHSDLRVYNIKQGLSGEYINLPYSRGRAKCHCGVPTGTLQTSVHVPNLADRSEYKITKTGLSYFKASQRNFKPDRRASSSRR